MGVASSSMHDSTMCGVISLFPTKRRIKDGEEGIADIKSVEKILGYKFRWRSLVVEALTHPSYFYPEKKGCYERLEFVGDAVLNFIMAMDLYATYTHLEPGLLTMIRSTNVDTEKLARVAVNHGLYKYLRHKAEPLQGQIDEFITEMADYPLHSKGLIKAPKFLADMVESLIGAVFIDSNNFYKAYEVSKELIKPIIGLDEMAQHPMSKLYEFCQKRKMELKFLDTWKANKTMTAVINGFAVASASYRDQKEITKNRAAKAAFDKLSDDENLLQFLEKLQELEKFQEVPLEV